VLLRHDNPLFPPAAYEAVSQVTVSRSLVARLIPSPSINLANRRLLVRLHETLMQRGARKVLVVGGGAQRAWLGPLLGGNELNGLQITYTDIDIGADVDLFCDAHELPFSDDTQDAVITTAVLEHVLYPERAAAEIHRVLRTGGLLYSEMPFMQQVHEGAYDFTRYTLSGHRRLFNHFAELDSGMVAGPATALVWAIENFMLAFVSRPRLRLAMKALVRIGAGWIKHLDHLLINRPQAMDGASCTYFLGTKVEEPIPDSEIVARYVGAKHVRHI
jgi:SAM-dependent methyltransferase